MLETLTSCENKTIARLQENPITIDMSLQEMFDANWNHFVVDGADRSYDAEAPGPYCRYRGPNGTKCAVGLLINDDEYDPAIEMIGSINSLIAEEVLVFKQDPENAHELCEHLQDVHDGIGPNEDVQAEFKRGLTAVARVFGLTIPSES